MAQTYTCPQGHRWESAAGDGAGVAVQVVACPVCGADCRRTTDGVATEDAVTATRSAEAARSTDASAAPGRAAPPSGVSAVPGYELLGILGRGGMGVVYRARQLGLNRLVALKVLLAGQHATAAQRLRFQLEAEALASLQHPNIVQVHDVGEHDDCPFLAMELVEGVNLAHYLGGRPVAPREAAVLVRSLAAAIHAAHLRGIVHRDLKPANILLALQGTPAGARLSDATPKITDFGLAKRLEEDAGHTMTGMVLGTPAYMAPEQACGDVRRVGPPADTYALGIILYEALTGTNPLRDLRPAERFGPAVAAHLKPPRQLVPNVPHDLETICLKCLRDDPASRYGSAQELADDLGCYLDGRPIRARRVGRAERLVKWCRRHPAWAVLLAALALGTPAGLGVFAWTEARVRASARAVRASSDLARGAVDEMYTRVAEEWLADEPFKDPVQQDFLAKAAAIYERLSASAGDDPAVRQQAARAYFRLGQIYHKLNRSDDAAAAYARAITLQEALRDAHDVEADYRQDLANSYNWLGELYREGSRPIADAEALYHKALGLQEQLVLERPDNAAYLRELARSHGNLGIVQLDGDRKEAAGKHFAAAVEALERLRQAEPRDVDVRHELARAYINRGVWHKADRRPDRAAADYQAALDLLGGLRRAQPARVVFSRDEALAGHDLGNLLWSQGRHNDAARVLRQARERLQELADNYPLRPAYRADLARVLNSLGSVQAAAGQRPDAARTWQEAAADLRRLTDTYPEAVPYRHQRAVTLGNLAWLRSEEEGALDEADRLLSEAIGQLQEALQTRPGDVPCLEALRNQYQNRAEVLLRQRDHAAAARAADALAEVFPDRAQDRYYAACFLARCVPLATGAAARDYGDRAMGHLRRAAALSGAGLRRIPEEARIFQALQDRPELASLLRRLTKPAT